VCSGSGTLSVYTGFAVTRAVVGFATLPFAQDEEMSSSSESSSSSSSSESSYSESESSNSESSISESESSSSESSVSESISSNSSQTEIISGLPRLYVSGYTNTGFIVSFENIPSQVGYIEFSFSAV